MAWRCTDRPSEAASDALVGLIYDCVLRDDLLDVLLAKVAEHFGATSAILVYVDPANAIATFSLAHGVIADPDIQSRYNREFAALDPAPAAMSNLKLGQAASTDLVFANSMDRCKPFLDNFLHPLGLGGALAGVVANEAGKLGFFALHRPLERRIFDERDVASYEYLMQHVARMLHLRQAFYGLASQLGLHDLVFEQDGAGIMLLGLDKHLVRANCASRAILARDDGLHLNALGVLNVQDGEARLALDTAFASVRDGDSIVIVPRREASLPYVLRVSGVRTDADVDHRAIRIWDPDREIGDTSTLLRQAFGLTGSSAKLVSALLTGDTLEIYAARSGLSRSTAKFHLNAAFDATGTRRQSQLLKLAASLVGDLARVEH